MEKILNSTWKQERPGLFRATRKGKNEAGGIATSEFELYHIYHTDMIIKSMALSHKQTHISMK